MLQNTQQSISSPPCLTDKSFNAHTHTHTPCLSSDDSDSVCVCVCAFSSFQQLSVVDNTFVPSEAQWKIATTARKCECLQASSVGSSPRQKQQRSFFFLGWSEMILCLLGMMRAGPVSPLEGFYRAARPGRSCNGRSCNTSDKTCQQDEGRSDRVLYKYGIPPPLPPSISFQ